MIHHIAIGTPEVLEIAHFYLQLPGSKKEKEWLDEDGTLRSIWIQMEGFLLMIEKGTKMGPRALVFAYSNREEEKWKSFLHQVKITHRTNFTAYFEDPDGNQVGVSHYPEPLPI